jgi:amidase
MTLHQYSRLDALELSQLIKQKQISAHELVQLAQQTIAQTNPKLNAVIGPIEPKLDFDPQAPFAGVPILLKDLGQFLAGVPCEGGSRMLKGRFVPSTDSEIIKRIKGAGFIPIGRTNTPEFGINVSTEPLSYGPTRNPWNLEYSVGGSSGGAAASVAAGMVPIAHGSDAGGSIRIPAACCGVVGLKPSRGRTAWGRGAWEGLHGLSVQFANSRSLRDSAALLDVLQVPGGGHKYGLQKHPESYLDAISARPKPLRIAVTTNWQGVNADAESSDAARKTADLLESLGHQVIEDRPHYDLEAYIRSATILYSSSITGTIESYRQTLQVEPSEANLEATIWQMYRLGLKTSALELERALAFFNQVCWKMGDFFAGYDAMLTPTLATVPVKLGYYNANDPTLDAFAWFARRMTGFGLFTTPFNATGQPALSLPLYQSQSGLPIGVQLIGPYAGEALLFSLGGQLEQALPWGQRRPDGSSWER